jgi:RNA polymerase sigma-70 factor (ECF subfamily)
MNQGERGALDQTALERLYLRLERPLYNVVFRWLWHAEDTRDVVQEAFVRLWRMRDRIELGTVEPLLYRIALNLAANRRRARRVRAWLTPFAVIGDPAPLPDEALAGGERALAVRRAVEALPPALRSVILLCELSSMSYDEVGRALGIPAGTVGSRRNKALRLLEERLGAFAEKEVAHAET